MSAESQPQPAAIPLSDLSAKATADYQGDALSITAASDGALLRCGFQKLEGHATPEGLWIESTEHDAVGKLRIIATAVLRADPSVISHQPSALLPSTGTVSVVDRLVRFIRPGVTEEYSVSVDGVRQDFVINQRPAGAGDLRVELTLSGARAESAAAGARLRLEGSGRVLGYNRLRAQDATGEELKTRLEVISTNRLSVIVADADAPYPICIDPTLSDADWGILNSGMPGADDQVSQIAVDGSGNVYVAGGFNFIGTVPANRIAKWDGNGWSALDSGSDYIQINALVVMGTNLYAAGSFDGIGGVPATNIAKWDGSVWAPLGSGIDGSVVALAVSGTNLYAGGHFAKAGDVSANCITKWDGSTWSALGSGVAGGSYPQVNALVANENSLYVGGSFTNAGGLPANFIAKWDGSTWSTLSSGTDRYVDVLAVIGTNLYAAGDFWHAGGAWAPHLARWDGNAWSAVAGAQLTRVSTLAVSSTNLYAAGYALIDTGGPEYEPVSRIVKWDGITWSVLASEAGERVFHALALFGEQIYAGGYFTNVSGVPAINLAKWDGSVWSAMGEGIYASSISAFALQGSNLYMGGEFVLVGGVLASNIAKWDGSAWSPLGSGVDGAVTALAADGTNLYAGGRFHSAGGQTAVGVAKWDGGAWSGLGTGIDTYDGFYVSALATMGTNLYAGGTFSGRNIARWDGRTWSSVGSGLGSWGSHVSALAVSGNNLYAAGQFATAGSLPVNNIAKWDGKAWSALGSGIGGESAGVNAMTVIGSDLYVGGHFATAGGKQVNNVAKWDGSSWSALGAGTDGVPGAFAVIGTDLYAAGGFNPVPELPANHILKWDGNTWSALGSEISRSVVSLDDGVYLLGIGAIAADAMGHLFVGGNFCLGGTNVSPFVAQANLGREPTILTPPKSQTAEVGSLAEFILEATGYPPPIYLLYFSATNLVRSGSDCELGLPDVDTSSSGSYTVVISNLLGAVTSAPVVLNVIPAVERRPVPAVTLFGQAGGLMGLESSESLDPAANWETATTSALGDASLLHIDVTAPLPAQRFYRGWQSPNPGSAPVLDLQMVPAISLTGNVGDTLRLDYINAIGPTDAWETLDTVTLTNTSQLYFDVSSIGQPRRLYRIVPVP